MHGRNAAVSNDTAVGKTLCREPGSRVDSGQYGRARAVIVTLVQGTTANRRTSALAGEQATPAAPQLEICHEPVLLDSGSPVLLVLSASRVSAPLRACADGAQTRLRSR